MLVNKSLTCNHSPKCEIEKNGYLKKRKIRTRLSNLTIFDSFCDNQACKRGKRGFNNTPISEKQKADSKRAKNASSLTDYSNEYFHKNYRKENINESISSKPKILDMVSQKKYSVNCKITKSQDRKFVLNNLKKVSGILINKTNKNPYENKYIQVSRCKLFEVNSCIEKNSDHLKKYKAAKIDQKIHNLLSGIYMNKVKYDVIFQSRHHCRSTTRNQNQNNRENELCSTQISIEKNKLGQLIWNNVILANALKG